MTDVVRAEPEQRVVIRNANWRLYQDLLRAKGDASAPRLSYSRGLLEMMSPGVDLEKTNRTLALPCGTDPGSPTRDGEIRRSRP